MASGTGLHAAGAQLTILDHVGVAVLDLDAAIEFYSSVFGLTVVHEEVNEHAGIKEVMLAVGDTETCIQLLAPLSPESVIAKFLDRSGPGVQHLAFRVDDVVAASKTLRDKGVRVLHQEPVVGTAGSLINFGHPRDCGGVLIELVEVKPRTGT
jgi:methylmalonyl-CoA/ethylmalonyl-CoA epimerase